MEQKLGAMLVFSGLAWSCVNTLPVDTEGTGSGGESGAGTGGAETATGGAETGAGGESASVATGGSGTGVSTTGGAVSTGGKSAATPTGGTSGEPPDEDAICPFDGELEYDPAAAYPFCNGTETFDFAPPDPSSGLDSTTERCRGKTPGSSVGAGRHSWVSEDGSPDGEALRYCLCTVECEADADCAPSESGDAVPSCIEQFCHLTCDADEACPEGMICTQDQESNHRVCMWGSRGTGCDTSDWPNVTP